MQENTNKRKWSSHVSFNRLEMSDAQAKMKDLGFKTLPQLVRHTIEILDTPRAVQVQELEKRVTELCIILASARAEKAKAETALGIAEKNAEYWENYGKELISEKNELTEQLLKETVRYEILNGAHNVEMEKHNCLKDLACEYREARNSFEKQLYDAENQAKKMCSQRDEFERLMHDETDLANKHLHTSVERKQDHEKALKRIATKLGVPDTVDHIVEALVEFNAKCEERANSEEGRKQAEKRVGYLTARIEILHELAYANVAVFLWRRFHGFFFYPIQRLFKGKEIENGQAEKEKVAESEKDE